nr:uncharacterized protein LOC105337688 isoform X2 [Crassostrea gigas]
MAPATIVYKLILFGVMFAAITAFDADAIAQAACSASTSDGIVSAIRRTCGSGQDSCNTICSNAISSMRAIYGIQGSATAALFKPLQKTQSGQPVSQHFTFTTNIPL